MSNNIYGQQIYGQRVLASNVINNGPITYQQFGQHQQQPIYYSQNQNYIGMAYNQQPKNEGQLYHYNQVRAIPGYNINNPQLQNNQLQNIYQQQNNQLNFYQQNQNKNIYQQQAIFHQQAQNNQMMKQQIVMGNQLIQQKSKNAPKINEFSKISKEAVLYGRAKPMNQSETEDLYSYESAICKIKFKTLEKGQIKNGIGTGFFLEINDANIPFKKALFTNNHVLDENRIEMYKEIEFEYCKKPKEIIRTENRKAFTNKELDYTCIEIFDTDNINKFFRIDETVINNKNLLKNKEIFILQYPNGELAHDAGIILDINNNIIKHSVCTEKGASGSPLIKRYNNNLIIGIHHGSKSLDKKYLYNLATPFDIIIKDIKDQFLNNNKNTINKINLIYVKKDENDYEIFEKQYYQRP